MAASIAKQLNHFGKSLTIEGFADEFQEFLVIYIIL